MQGSIRGFSSYEMVEILGKFLAYFNILNMTNTCFNSQQNINKEDVCPGGDLNRQFLL